jgi:hypothetical protein
MANEHQVTAALLAQLDQLQRCKLGTGTQFVLPFWLLSDLEVIAGRTVLRADVEPARRWSIDIGRHHDQASTMTCLPGISDSHPDQFGTSSRSASLGPLRSMSFSARRALVRNAGRSTFSIAAAGDCRRCRGFGCGRQRAHSRGMI